MKNIGEKIYNLRKTKGISQEELADLVGVSRQTIYKWESNSVEPSRENKKTLSAVLDVSYDYFCDDVEIKVANEIAVADSDNKIKSKKPIIIGLVICSIVLLILGIISVWFGCAVFTSNKSNVSANSFQISLPMFIAAIVFVAIDLSIEILLIVLLVKKCKCKHDVNLM